MTRDSQKTSELEVVQNFFKMAGVLGTVSINPAKNDPPDILLDMNGDRVGIEVTEYHQSSSHRYPRKQVEVEWKKIQERIASYREEREKAEKGQN